MKLIVKFAISIITFFVVAYFGSALVMPSVTIVNNSGDFIEQIEVALPSSNLDFGSLKNGEHNTLHYALEQNDGVYSYQFKREDLAVVRGTCGNVASYEFHKRVLITINKNNKIVCS